MRTLPSTTLKRRWLPGNLVVVWRKGQCEPCPSTTLKRRWLPGNLVVVWRKGSRKRGCVKFRTSPSILITQQNLASRTIETDSLNNRQSEQPGPNKQTLNLASRTTETDSLNSRQSEPPDPNKQTLNLASQTAEADSPNSRQSEQPGTGGRTAVRPFG